MERDKPKINEPKFPLLCYKWGRSCLENGLKGLLYSIGCGLEEGVIRFSRGVICGGHGSLLAIVVSMGNSGSLEVMYQRMRLQDCRWI